MAGTTPNQPQYDTSSGALAVEERRRVQQRERVLAAMINDEGTFLEIDKPDRGVCQVPKQRIELPPPFGWLIRASRATIIRRHQDNTESTVDVELMRRAGHHIRYITLRERRVLPDANITRSTSITLDGDGVLLGFSSSVEQDRQIIDEIVYDEYDQGPDAERAAHRHFLRMTAGIVEDTNDEVDSSSIL